MRRDGPLCVWCGHDLLLAGIHAGPADRHATADHITPRSAGGSNAMWNLVLACNVCNNARGATPVDVWVGMCRFDGLDVQEALVKAALERVRHGGRMRHLAVGVQRVLHSHRNTCPHCGGVMLRRSGVSRFCPWCVAKL